jgi:hypothetical protein
MYIHNVLAISRVNGLSFAKAERPFDLRLLSQAARANL